MNKGQRVGYKRVSTVDQETVRQLDGIDLDRTFEDKASGKDTNRPQLQAALAYLREGDTFVIHTIDRLARNTINLLSMVKELNERGVTVRFVKDNLTFDPKETNSKDNLMMTMLAAFAEFERSMIRERQREGIAIAKSEGRYKGRAPKLDASQIAALRARVDANEEKATIARDFGISRQSLYRYLAT